MKIFFIIIIVGIISYSVHKYIKNKSDQKELNKPITTPKEVKLGLANPNMYFIGYRFLPQLIELYKNGKISLDTLINRNVWRELLQDEFELESILVKVIKIKNTTIIVYIFPNPQKVTDLKYSAINLTDLSYYTLELSLGPTWILGGQNLERHINYGDVGNRITELDFINLIYYGKNKKSSAMTLFHKNPHKESDEKGYASPSASPNERK